MPKQRGEPDTSTYPGRIGARLGELLTRDGLSAAAAVERINQHLPKGVDPLKEFTLRKYLRGGAAVPPKFYAAIAKAFGFKSPRSWLPTE